MKTKITITLSDYESALFNEALCVTWGKDSPEKIGRSERKHYIEVCLSVVSAAVTRAGGLTMPPAVTLRTETREETEYRIAKLFHRHDDKKPLGVWRMFAPAERAIKPL